MFRRTLCSVGMLAAVASLACVGPGAPATLTEVERAALADSVGEAVRSAFHVVDSIPCERPDSLLDRMATFRHGPFLFSADTMVATFTREASLEFMKGAECPSPVRNARLVGNVEVQILSRDHAVVAWKYDEELRVAEGRYQRVVGAVLETLVRTPSGWRGTSRKGSQVHVGEPRRLSDQ